MIAPSGKTFTGWETDGATYQAGAYYTVNSNVTFTARWGAAVPVPSDSLARALMWISANAEEGGVYTITLNADETSTPCHLFFSGKTVSITLTGGAAERTIDLSSNGSLFTVPSGVTLTLGSNVTLRGRSNNTSSLVHVGSGATLVMEDGSKISGNSNTSSSYGGGGVYVAGGTFTMSGGEIAGNTASSSSSSGGGGVYVGEDGTFTMSGGEIAGNTAYAGGGVYVGEDGTFTMSGQSTIYGSDASAALKNTTQGGNGHAVYVSSSPAKMRNTTAGPDVDLNSAWADLSTPPIPVTGITYDDAWELQGDGRRKSPAISHDSVSKARVSFTATDNAGIVIQLDVSSESGFDYAFISQLNNSAASSSSGYYPGSKISGTRSVTITIPVPTAGSYFVDIGYKKNYTTSSGSDCAWFKVIE
jgi:hypothetical protein